MTLIRLTGVTKSFPSPTRGGGQVVAVDDVSVAGIESQRPTVRYRHEGRRHVLECDLVAGCDGFHGVSRASIPAGALTTYHREYPFAWLGILADVPPSTFELIYACDRRGFALRQ